MFSIVYNEL